MAQNWQVMYGNSALKSNKWDPEKDIIHFMEGFMCFVSSSLNGNSAIPTSGDGAQAINTNKMEEVSSVSES